MSSVILRSTSAPGSRPRTPAGTKLDTTSSSSMKKGVRTPSASVCSANVTVTGVGSSVRKGVRTFRTPASVGSTRKGVRRYEPELIPRNYDQDLNLKPNDVLDLLSVINSSGVGIANRAEPVCLKQLIEKHLHSHKKVTRPACTQNLLQAFTAKDGDDSSCKSSVSTSVSQLQHQFEKMGDGDEEAEAKLNTENQVQLKPFEILVDRFESQADKFASSYKQHSEDIYQMERDGFSRPNEISSAVHSVKRLVDSVGKVSSTNSTKSKILRQNMNYEGEGIPCSFESRSDVVNAMQNLDKTVHRQIRFTKLEVDETYFKKQVSQLKSHLDQLEMDNTKLASENEKINKLIKQCEQVNLE